MCIAEYSLNRIPPEVYLEPDSPLAFYRDFVSQNKPVIIRNGVYNWPALKYWSENEYLLEKCNSEKLIKVSVTPNGYADAITEGKFVMPHEEEMTLESFLKIMKNPGNNVYYIQRQNSNLIEEMSELMEDIQELPWAKEAFNKEPDAINFWMGDSRAVTSTHKDPYENIYCVVKGYKDITLFPPTDLPWLPYEMFDQAIFEKNMDGNFSIKTLDENPKIPWIPVDPLNPDLEKYPDFVNAHPVKLRLNAGDVLYLPSLWFHHLKQSQGCIAVNFWYDMDFDVKFNYFNFVKDICEIRQ